LHTLLHAARKITRRFIHTIDRNLGFGQQRRAAFPHFADMPPFCHQKPLCDIAPCADIHSKPQMGMLIHHPNHKIS
jgi:hypothetical protein